jgi:2-haloacid dehalogenase
MQPAAIVFDLFGTLLDIRSLETAAARWTAEPAALVTSWREKQLGYAFAAAILDRYADFDELTARALQYALERQGLSAVGPAERAALCAAWSEVAPYPDALPALDALRRRDIRCAVLTNGTPATARAAIVNAGLTDAIDVTLSVDAVQTYKPNRRVYTLATEHYATTADRLVFVTANGWDATGAAAFGMTVAWCNRLGAPAETFGPPPTWTIRGLAELADLIETAPSPA